jgi:hypothetical protein
MTEIPKQLQNPEFRFILLEKRNVTDTKLRKHPIENDWQTAANYKYDDSKLLDWIANGGNYGVLCGFGNLIVLDIDAKELDDALLVLGKTFSIKTSRGFHHYFICKDCPGNYPLDKDNVHYGEIRAKKQQVVGAGSLHPSGIEYGVADDLPIAEIKFDELKVALKNIADLEPRIPRIIQSTGHGLNLPITEVFDISTLQQRGDEFFGAHPIHGSTTGQNFWINPAKNIWHCFRCNSGGSTIDLIAVLERVVDCKDAKPEIIKGELFKKALDIARNKYGLQVKEEGDIVLSDLLQNPLPPIEYWMQQLMPKGAFMIVGGRPGSWKSLFLLSSSLSAAKGESFLGQFQTIESPKILLYDLENGQREDHRRVTYLMDINTIKPGQFDNFIIRESFDKNNMRRELERAMHFDVVILDSYRRFLKGEENASEVTDALYNNFFKPLHEAGKTVIVVHHFRKAKPEEVTDDDLLDMFRGSSDIGAQVDIALALFKTQEQFTPGRLEFDVSVFKAKNRLGISMPNFAFHVIKDDDDMSTTLTYVGEKKWQTPEMIRIDKICKFLEDGPKRTREIYGLFSNVSTRTVLNALQEGVARERIVEESKGIYKLPEHFEIQETLEKKDDNTL